MAHVVDVTVESEKTNAIYLVIITEQMIAG
jgi:hypothetical protein